MRVDAGRVLRMRLAPRHWLRAVRSAHAVDWRQRAAEWMTAGVQRDHHLGLRLRLLISASDRVTAVRLIG